MYNPNSNMPLVSVIIPTYNRKNMLKEAVDSVLEQNYENIEIIVSDNNSQDGTDILMQEYLEDNKNIIYIRRDKNIGAHANGYRAYKDVSKGKYILFLCDDDYLMSITFIKKAVNILETNNNVSLVTGMITMKVDSSFLYITLDYTQDTLIKGIDYFMDQSTVTMPGKYPEIISTLYLTRREHIEKNPFFSSFEASGDLCIRFYNLLFLGDVYFIHDMIACYRIHNSIRDSFDFNRLKENVNDVLNFTKYLYDKSNIVYPEYKTFWEKYISLKIADNYFRQLVESYLSVSNKKNLEKIINFWDNNFIKEKNKYIYDFISMLISRNKRNMKSKKLFNFSLFYINVVNDLFDILIFGNYNIGSLFRVFKTKNRLLLSLFFINITIKLDNIDIFKNKYENIVRGVYARRDIKKYEFVEEKDIYYSFFIDDSQVNSNFTFGTKKYYSKKDIKRGEQITYNILQTRPDQTRPDQTRPDQTRPELIYVAITHIFIIIQNIKNYNLYCNAKLRHRL